MKRKIKILSVFGTRPEVIKLAPFIKQVESDPDCIGMTCATTQHRQLQNDALDLFQIVPTFYLDIMRENQDLSYITHTVLTGVTEIIEQKNPDFVVVQGDTTTAFAAALAGFYKKIPIVHLEAGLRTENIFSPFPEECNRRLISQMTTLHMAPTQRAKENLLKEGTVDNVFMVGNTIVDSVHWGLEHFKIRNNFIQKIIKDNEKKILITVHRRENFGKPLEGICEAVKDLCARYPHYCFIWPVHPNPNVHVTVHQRLGKIPNLHLINPLSYDDLLILTDYCSLIISDSGGIQEEACILGKKIIVLREETERVEIIEAGIGVLVGSNKDKIIEACGKLLNHTNVSSINLKNIYGSCGVSRNIVEKIKLFYQSCQ